MITMMKPKPSVAALLPESLADFAASLTEDDLPPYHKLAHPNLWWSAVSGLQKAIRRGEVEVAISTALMLFMAQGKRLTRRLAVIAVEDVCFGNFAAVQVAVQYAHTGIPGNGADVLYRLAGLVQSLAGGVKDRSACELLVSAAYDLTPERAEKLVSVDPGVNAKVYEQRHGENVRGQLLAGLVLVGDLKFNGMPYGMSDVKLARQSIGNLTDDPGLLSTVDSLLALGKELAAYAMALPMLWGAVQKVKFSTRVNLLTFQTRIGGNLSTAYDMHTMEGKRALGYWVNANRALRVFLRTRGYDPKAVVGNLLFMAEGSLVNREFAYALGDELDKLNQEAQCRKIGVDPVDLPALLEIVRAGIPLLNQLREKVVKSFNYAVNNEKQAVLI